MTFYRFMGAASLGCLLAIPITWATAETKAPKKEDEKLVCVSNAELDKNMTEKGYDILLQMTNENDVKQTIWLYGQSIVITASVPKEETSCLLATMKNVTYNPKAIEEVWETYKKQTKQKDI